MLDGLRPAPQQAETHRSLPPIGFTEAQPILAARRYPEPTSQILHILPSDPARP